MTKISKVEDSVFYFLTSNDKGGAISNKQEDNLLVSNCAFSAVTANDVGGAIYKEKGRIGINKCAFCYCRTTHEENNNGGNAIKAINCYLSGDLFCMYKSWCSYESGDSCVHTYNCYISFKDGNTTHCTHLQLYSSTFLESIAASEETLTYINIYGGDCYRCTYFSSSVDETTANHLSFIHAKSQILLKVQKHAH